MNLEQRTAELERDVWYTTPFRLRQWQASHEAYMFGWMVREARRVGNASIVWDAIEDQLRDWEPTIVH